MTKDVALRLALEALTYIYTETTADEDELIDQAIAAIKEALAQPKEPEPVAWMSEHRLDELSKGFPVMKILTKQRVFEDDVAFYTTPPQRKPLTDEMLDDIYYCVEGGRNELETWRQQARAVEAAHGIKE